MGWKTVLPLPGLGLANRQTHQRKAHGTGTHPGSRGLVQPMKVTAHFHGILADWVGTRSAGFELSNDATYADLIKEIRRRFGSNMPAQLWDMEIKLAERSDIH